MIHIRDIEFEDEVIIYIVLDRSMICCDRFEAAQRLYKNNISYYIGSLDNNICKKYEDSKYLYRETYEQRLKAFDL